MKRRKKRIAWWQHPNWKRSATWAWPIIITIAEKEMESEHKIEAGFYFDATSAHCVTKTTWQNNELHTATEVQRYWCLSTILSVLHRHIFALYTLQRQSCTIFLAFMHWNPFFIISFFSSIWNRFMCAFTMHNAQNICQIPIWL